MDATYHLAGGFKPTIKRFADLDGPDFFSNASLGHLCSHRQREIFWRDLGERLRKRGNVTSVGENRMLCV